MFIRRVDNNTIQVWDQNWLAKPEPAPTPWVPLGYVGRHQRLRIITPTPASPNPGDLNRYYVVVKKR